METRRTIVLLLLSAGGLCGQDPPVPVPDTVSVEANIPYGAYKETVLDIIRPRAEGEQKLPGVLIIHGGGWTAGDKEHLMPFCLAWVEQGFVVANIEYRLAKVAPAPAAITDALTAAQWFRQNAARYRVDPKRIVVAGGSAGGHLALMVGLAPASAGFGPPARMAAIVNMYGVTDVAYHIGEHNRSRSGVSWIPEGANRLELARRVSPMNYVRKGVPPVLTIHGDADPTVSYDQGLCLTNALRAAGVDTELVTVAGAAMGSREPG